MALRCLIVDDSPRFLAAARGLLEREGIWSWPWRRMAPMRSGTPWKLRPDVTLVDIDLGRRERLRRRTAADPRDRAGAVAVILISTHAEEDYADLIAASPAAGFLPKTRLSAGAIRDLLGSRLTAASPSAASRKVTTASTRR